MDNNEYGMITDKLMSGNWLYSELNKQNFCATPEDIFNISQNNSCASGIPLTPEILEKCGFIERGSLYSNGMGNALFFDFHKSNMHMAFYGGYMPIIKSNIKYLHSMQNLYYALTGEELKVQL